MNSERTLNYKKTKEFMEEYYTVYNQCAQDAETIDEMDRFWAPEFIAVVYFPVPEYPTFDLASWKSFLVQVHTNVLETLTSLEIAVDTKEMMVTSRVNIKNHDRSTNELLLEDDGIGFYDLKVDENNELKITRLQLFCADPEALMELSMMSLSFNSEYVKSFRGHHTLKQMVKK